MEELPRGEKLQQLLKQIQLESGGNQGVAVPKGGQEVTPQAGYVMCMLPTIYVRSVQPCIAVRLAALLSRPLVRTSAKCLSTYADLIKCPWLAAGLMGRSDPSC